MILTKRLIIVSFFLFICGGSAFSQEGLLINADNVSYLKDKNIIEAEGNVHATYKEMVITGDRLVYDTADRTVFSDQGFVLDLPEKRFIGAKLEYNIDTNVGTAELVDMEFKGLYITGKEVKISTEEIGMTDASFTSCDSSPPHYHMSASSITLYPETGWVVAYWGFFWIGNIPLIPVPTYLYDLGPRGDRRNFAPVPEIGKNEFDGVYGVERFAWHMSNRLYGLLELTLTEKKGGGAAIKGNYIMDDQNEFYFRLGFLEKDNTFGGITYIYSFGPEIIFTEEELSVYDMFNLPKTRLYEFEMDIKSRERINFQRITALPDLTFRLVKESLLNGNILLNGEIGYGHLAEESTSIDRYRSRVKFDFIHPRDLGSLGYLKLTVTPDYKWYEDREIWQLLKGDIDLTKHWTETFETGIGYLHYFLTEGSPPFAFETYYFKPNDEFRENFMIRFNESSFGTEIFHYMPDWYPKDVDYTLTMAQHCYDFMVKYRAMREEFYFGLSLTAR